MRRTHKNKIFEILNQSPLGIGKFNSQESTGAGSTGAMTILIDKTPFQFVVEPLPHNFEAYNVSYTTYGPAYPTATVGGAALNIESLLIQLKIWLATHIKAYYEDEAAIDLWAEYKRGGEFLEIGDLQINDTSYFSKDDQTRIRFAIEDLKILIPAKFQVSEEQLLSINAKLDYLVDASGRVSKTDWKGIAIGIVASIIIALSLDTEMGRKLWEFFMQAFRTIQLLP